MARIRSNYPMEQLRGVALLWENEAVDNKETKVSLDSMAFMIATGSALIKVSRLYVL